jgi:hypothetical protein
MKRRLGFGFVIVFVAAVVVAACGRQVTPNPPGLGPGGTPVGYMSIFFTVGATFNFSSYQYMVVFNTSGDGVTPSTDTLQTNWRGYDYAVIALGNGVSSFARAAQFRRSTQNPHIPPSILYFGTTPQQFSFNLNANGTQSEFSVLAQRSIFASPAPSASPSNSWTFNAFTTQANNLGQWVFYDSMGSGGPVDPQFVSPVLNMTQCFDSTFFARYTGVSDPAAQIVTIEIANNPVENPCPPS